MKKKTVTIANHQGIHCRPSTEIIMKSQEYLDCDFTIESKGTSAELNSMLSLLSMGLVEGDDVTIVADGENEDEACDVIAALFAFNFDFPPNE